jgi:pyruvate/2-oxoglutarate dehydrogenase complex dihydrolipoamide acyltransferase (E2) component
VSNSNKASLFRKIALSIWNQHGDPSVYSFVELDVTDLEPKNQLLCFLVKALGETMNKNKELHSLIRWGQIEQRKDKSISVMVNIPGVEKDDLSALNLEDVHLMTMLEIENKIETKAQSIRTFRDPHLGPVLNLLRFLPRICVKSFLNIYEFLIYELGTRLGLRFLPYKPFGSIIVSNVGSLGINNALLPLVPLARATLMVALGKISQQPRYYDKIICVRDIVQIGITFDHRLFDGSHASRMLADFEKSFYALISNRGERL